MGAEHWTEDDLLQHVYGIGTADERHLSACPNCRARLDDMRRQRRAIMADSEISNDFLAAQRRSIYQRIGQRASFAPWAPALAAMLMLLIALLVFRPGQPGTHPAPNKTDDAVFAEIYSIEQSSEPAATKTMHALFENE
jgi:anti-sigma factor RsiW